LFNKRNNDALAPQPGHPRRRTRLLTGGATISTAVLALLVTTSPAEAAEDGSFDGCPVLIEGRSTGECVAKLQTELNAVNPAYGLTPDGTFGPGTRIAVLDFQGRNGLGADGTVGRSTAQKLQQQFDAIPVVDSPKPSPTPAPACPDASQKLPVDLLPVRPPAIDELVRQSVNMSYGDLKLTFSSVPTTTPGAVCTLQSNRGALPIVLHNYAQFRLAPPLGPGIGPRVNVGNLTVAHSVTTATLTVVPRSAVSIQKCDFAVMRALQRQILFESTPKPNNAMDCLLNDFSDEPATYYVKWSIPGFEEWAPDEKHGVKAYETQALSYYVDIKTLTSGAPLDRIDATLVDRAENYIHRTLIENMPQITPVGIVQKALGD
jgi:peptidoglycan hydrolase-like protein with peptidoglycan-binding domain